MFTQWSLSMMYKRRSRPNDLNLCVCWCVWGTFHHCTLNHWSTAWPWMDSTVKIFRVYHANERMKWKSFEFKIMCLSFDWHEWHIKFDLNVMNEMPFFFPKCLKLGKIHILRIGSLMHECAFELNWPHCTRGLIGIKELECTEL